MNSETSSSSVVADHVREDVDTRAKQILRVTQIGRVHRDSQLVLVRFVDDGAIELGRQLLDRAAAIVNPRLDQPDLARHQFLHRRACAFRRGHRKRRLPHVVRTDLDQRRQPAACRQEPRSVGILASEDVVADLERQLAEVAPHRLARGDTEVREPVHVVEDVLSRVVDRPARQVLHVADVRVPIDECRNDGLAAQIYASGTRRCLNFTASSHASESRVLDEERGALDRRVAVADDEARPLVEGGARRGWLLGACLSEPDEGKQAGDGDQESTHQVASDYFLVAGMSPSTIVTTKPVAGPFPSPSNRTVPPIGG